jgi:hypothetical protein
MVNAALHVDNKGKADFGNHRRIVYNDILLERTHVFPELALEDTDHFTSALRGAQEGAND